MLHIQQTEHRKLIEAIKAELEGLTEKETRFLLYMLRELKKKRREG